LEQEAGVGVVVTEKDITETVKTVLDENRCQVETKGNRTNVGLLVKQVLSRLRFADARLVRSELERQLEDMLKNLSLSDKVEEKPKTTKTNKRSESNKARFEE